MAGTTMIKRSKPNTVLAVATGKVGPKAETSNFKPKPLPVVKAYKGPKPKGNR